jgi:hypothetical protein
VAAQAADYDERRKFQDAGQIPKPPPAKLAVDRLADLLAEARQRGLTKLNRKGVDVLSVTLPGTVELFNLYE